MKVFHFPRRQGKTTIALEILRTNPSCVLICMNGMRCSQLINENKDLEKRIFSVWDYKRSLRGKNFNKVIIDDGDCIPLSVLLKCINYFQESKLEIIITTSV